MVLVLMGVAFVSLHGEVLTAVLKYVKRIVTIMASV
jgi:hypothetical protein